MISKNEPTCMKIKEIGYKWTNIKKIMLVIFMLNEKSNNKDTRDQKRIKQ